MTENNITPNQESELVVDPLTAPPTVELIKGTHSEMKMREMLNTLQSHPDNHALMKSLKNQYPELSDEQLANLAGMINPSQAVYTDEEYRGNHETKSYHSKKYDRLSDDDLLLIAQQDPDLAAIITTRVSQMTVFAGEIDDPFDRGIKMVDLEDLSRDMFDTDYEFEKELKIRENEKKEIISWIRNCGNNDESVINKVYARSGRWHRNFSLKEYLQAQYRNLLICGRMARENIYSTDSSGNKRLEIFRPLPIEQIKPAVYKGEKPIRVSEISDDDNNFAKHQAEEYNESAEYGRPLSFLQVVNGETVAVYTGDQISVKYYWRQSNYEYQYYPLCPIEQAIATVYLNHNIHKHLVNKFKSGVLARSMMVIRPNQQEKGISQKLPPKEIKSLVNSLKQMGRTENSHVTPVVSGNFDIQMVDLNPKTDNEWMDLKNNIKRSYCSTFQINPKEVNWGQLGDSGGLQSGDKAEEYEFGEERGLRIGADIMADDLNECMHARFPFSKSKYKLEFQGIGTQSRDKILEQMNAEQNITASMNDLYSKTEKNRQITLGGDMPMNSLWHSNVLRFAKMSEIRYHFYGDEKAKDDKELDFFIDPGLEGLRKQKRQEELELESLRLQVEQQKQAMEQQEAAMQQQSGSEQSINQPQEEEKSINFQKSMETINLWKKFDYNKE